MISVPRKGEKGSVIQWRRWRGCQHMQLSEMKKKAIKIGGDGLARAKPSGLQAIGKVLAENLVSAEGLAQALGKIWCPIRGSPAKILATITSSSLSSKHRVSDVP
jgi:hypothetical protein